MWGGGGVSGSANFIAAMRSELRMCRVWVYSTTLRGIAARTKMVGLRVVGVERHPRYRVWVPVVRVGGVRVDKLRDGSSCGPVAFSTAYLATVAEPVAGLACI